MEFVQKAPDVRLSCGIATYDKKRRRRAHGDDQAFVCKRSRCFGVLDGVSGSNTKYGPGSAERVSALMCHYCHEAAREYGQAGRSANPDTVLKHGLARLNAHADEERGSTTTLVAAVSALRSGRLALRIANVGDCGLVVVRPPSSSTGSASAAESSCGSDSSTSGGSTSSGDSTSSPATRPSKIRRAAAASGAAARPGAVPHVVFATVAGRLDGSMAHPHTLSAATTELGDQLVHSEAAVRVGDVLVAGSDGLFDNVGLEHVADLVVRFAKRTPDFLARALAVAALNGPKLDDVTVLVARLV